MDPVILFTGINWTRHCFPLTSNILLGIGVSEFLLSDLLVRFYFLCQFILICIVFYNYIRAVEQMLAVSEFTVFTICIRTDRPEQTV